MLSTTDIILQYVCPALGMITGNLMFGAPYSDTVEASKRGDLGTLNPTPWVFMAGNTFGWILYGMLLNNLFIFFANAPGFIFSIWLNMQAVKLQYEQYRSKLLRDSILLELNEKSSFVRQELPLILSSNNNNDIECNTIRHDEGDEKMFGHSSDQNVKLTTMLNGLQTNNNHNEYDTAAMTQLEGMTIDTQGNNRSNNNGINHTIIAATNNETTNSKQSSVLFDYAQIVGLVTAPNTHSPAKQESMVLVITVIWLAITTIISFATAFDSRTKELIVGFAVNLNLIFFYGAPLSTIITVLKTRSCSTIHIPTMITNTCNGIFWCAYGVALFDLFIAIPNAIGAITGFIQILLCFLYPRRPTASLKQ